MKRRLLSALLALTMLSWMPLAPAFAQEMAGEGLGDEEAFDDPEPEYLHSAADDVGDFFPISLTGLADAFIVRPGAVLLLSLSALTYVIAVGPTAITDGSEGVSELGEKLIADQARFVFTRRLGGSLEDRAGARTDF